MHLPPEISIVCTHTPSPKPWKSGIAAEVIGIPDGSIGELLYSAKIYLQTAELLAWTVIIVVISVLFEKLFMVLLRWIVKKLGMTGGAVHG